MVTPENILQPTWRIIFLELTVRAFRQLNLNYGLWSLGQSSDHDLYSKVKKINSGGGIELAQEQDVCAAISQEFLNSTFTNGNTIQGENRFYEINREVTNDLDQGRVDLFVNRYKIIDDKVKYSTIPVLIEAKRAHYFTPNLRTGVAAGPVLHYNRIKDDIEKLKKFRKSRDLKFKGYELFQFSSVLIYSLFWGLTTDRATIEQEVKKELNLKLENCSFKFLPIDWDTDNTAKVSQWCWICLYEIDPIDSKDAYLDVPK